MQAEAKMGARGELFTTEVYLEKRSYFFNVKQNRNGDVFLQIVETKNRDKETREERLQIAVFEDDMQKFFQGMDTALSFIERERKARVKKEREASEERIRKNLREEISPSSSRQRLRKRTTRVRIAKSKDIKESN